MTESRFTELFVRYLEQQTTGAEEKELWAAWEQDAPELARVKETLLGDAFERLPVSFPPTAQQSMGMLQRVMQTTDNVKVISMRRWWWAAAAIVLLLGSGITLWVNNGEKKPEVTAENKVIEAGKSGAILTLGDGTKLVLDSLGNGIVSAEKGASAFMKDGTLSYTPSGEPSMETAYNTMTTPKGRQFRVTLPDGTQVWLNSASSIRYPVAFAGNDRKVEITGEVYFEVTQKMNKPFIVQAGKRAEVHVLGTDFNINAYDNEPSLNTTLINGSVKVNGALLKPGQQAQVLNSADPVQVIHDADINKIMAWKNGRFNFEGVGIEAIMRQIERWYDVEVEYAGKKPKVDLEGEMTRDVSLNGLIMLMKKSGVECRLEGRKLIVLP
ncbi:MAG: FecR domain-containing protein [Pseudobacter sp.]|uniref:FecR domain-containing protein n=1 Tax=Pseudobacter sp. TaxID=2045420 RepID=UPI003F7ED387